MTMLPLAVTSTTPGSRWDAAKRASPPTTAATAADRGPRGAQPGEAILYDQHGDPGQYRGGGLDGGRGVLRLGRDDSEVGGHGQGGAGAHRGGVVPEIAGEPQPAVGGSRRGVRPAL